MSDKLKNIRQIDTWRVKEFLGEGAYAYAFEIESEEPSVLKWMVPTKRATIAVAI